MAGAMTDVSHMKGRAFAHTSRNPWQDMGGGVRRRILAYGDAIMLVHVAFEAGAVGAPHAHPHLQCTLVESGVFDVTIDGVTQRLGAGDSFFVASNLVHGVTAIEAGSLVDSFTPMRAEFIAGPEARSGPA
jgi:quercetin dioxygenase-like cupin family protein